MLFLSGLACLLFSSLSSLKEIGNWFSTIVFCILNSKHVFSFFFFLKLWNVHSANELRTIEIKDFFRNADEQQDDVEVLVKCCSWSRSSDTILVVAKNKLLVSISS